MAQNSNKNKNKIKLLDDALKDKYFFLEFASKVWQQDC